MRRKAFPAVLYGGRGEFRARGFTVTVREAGQEFGAVGEAWVRLRRPDGATYLLVSESAR